MVLSCVCGKVELELTGPPIASVACHCKDCHEGSLRIQTLPNGKPILDAFYGTPYVLYRKDRIKYLRGKELIKNLKVDDDSPNRAYASCCNSFILLDLPSPMHWVPLSRGLFKAPAPPLEMRINAKFKAESKTPSDVPTYSAFPFKFITKLLGAKLAMIFRS